MRNNMLADNIFINFRAGGICLLKILNDGIVNYVMSLVDKFSIMFLSGTDDNICQKFYGVSEDNRKRGVEPRSRTAISGTRLVTGSGMACCLPNIITAFW